MAIDEKSLEILAPVGGEEQLIAAVRSGADAVYLGLSSFNARRNAQNFDSDSLVNAVSYCHARNVKVHVTLNTCVLDHELSAVTDTIHSIAKAGVDAVIVQDLAVAKLVHEACPTLAMHASTQMAVHNLHGVNMLGRLGFTRAVLARELSIQEIQDICRHTSMEVEVFIHGALCMCASGMCTLSSMLGGRSGNRGLCAQPCRLDFSAGDRHYALSLKDLCGFAHLKALQQAGVCSVKIEGRMKRPEYVSAAVKACVDSRAGLLPDMDALQAVFSRSGFTDGYLTGKRNLSMFGNRTKEDVAKTATVLQKLKQEYAAEKCTIPINMTLLAVGNDISLIASDGENTVSIIKPEEISARQVDYETAYLHAGRSLSKTGGTPFFVKDISLQGDCVSLPVSCLNTMRREVLEQLLSIREKTTSHAFIHPELSGFQRHLGVKPPELRLRFAKSDQVCCVEYASKIIIPYEQIDEKTILAIGDKLIAELPRLLYPADEKKLLERLSELKRAGLKSILAENIYGFSIAEKAGLTVYGGFGLNVMNSESLNAYHRLGALDVTLSFETPAKFIRRMTGDAPRGIVAYGYLPLMYFRSCPMKQKDGCIDCRGNAHLKDRKGVLFAVDCHERKYSVMYNSVPLSLAGNEMEGVDFLTLYFTRETQAACKKIIADFRNGLSFELPHTRGLYYRDLL